jgi:glucose/arabinose dehydrogenase
MRVTRVAWLTCAIIGCKSTPPDGPAQRSPTPAFTPGVVKAEVVAEGLEHPWGLAMLPDGRMLVTERPGRLRIVAADGKLSPPLGGVPAVNAKEQGGLLDVALDPAFASNHVIYLSYAEPGPNGTSGTAVARAVLGDSVLTNVRVIYSQEPKLNSNLHYGSRIVFRPDSTMFVTQGERYTARKKAQDKLSYYGKILRLNRDGSVPKDNPFVGKSDALPAIWSYGHRNMQGAAIDPRTGRLWTVEHGARGGDELNHPEPGRNYGWPAITYGIDYNGSRIGSGAVADGMEQPVYYWDPVIAPSGLLIYSGDKFPQWKGNFFIGGLASMALVRLEMNGDRVVKEERYLGELHERIRDVVQGNDGYIYVITDSDRGRILRIVPA